MARTHSPDTWLLSSRDCDLLALLKRKTRTLIAQHGLTGANGEKLPESDKELSEAIGIDAGTFSQAQRWQDNPKNRKGFRAEQKQKLHDVLESSVEAIAEKLGKQNPSVFELKQLLKQLFGDKETPETTQYYSPGAFLPPDATNYIRRTMDDSLEHVAQSSAYAITVMGGPRTGKSSFLRRLHEVARKVGRDSRFIDLSSSWRHVLESRGARKLSVCDIANPIVAALTDGKVTTVTLDEDDPYETMRTLANRFSEYFSRYELTDTLVILDGFNDGADLGASPQDLVLVLGCMLGLGHHRIRANGLTIAVAEEGVASSSDSVSEYISRSRPFMMGRLVSDDVTAMRKSLSLDFDISGWEHRLLDICGSNIYLAHLILDRMRSATNRRWDGKSTEELAPPRQFERVLEDTLHTLRYGNAEENARTPLERDLARLRRRTERLLSQICAMVAKAVKENPADSCAGNHFLEVLADPAAHSGALPHHFAVHRALDWTGLIPEGSRVPTYLSFIARRMLAPDPSSPTDSVSLKE